MQTRPAGAVPVRDPEELVGDECSWRLPIHD
jgi:hypothetical protein